MYYRMPKHGIDQLSIRRTHVSALGTSGGSALGTSTGFASDVIIVGDPVTYNLR